MAAKIIRFLELCKLNYANCIMQKQIIRDKLRKYIKNHQLSQIIELKLSEKGFYTPFPTSY